MTGSTSDGAVRPLAQRPVVFGNLVSTVYSQPNLSLTYVPSHVSSYRWSRTTTTFVAILIFLFTLLRVCLDGAVRPLAQRPVVFDNLLTVDVEAALAPPS